MTTVDQHFGQGTSPDFGLAGLINARIYSARRLARAARWLGVVAWLVVAAGLCEAIAAGEWVGDGGTHSDWSLEVGVSIFIGGLALSALLNLLSAWARTLAARQLFEATQQLGRQL